MIPPNLHWAFEAGHYVRTPAGAGKMMRHRLADLVLPSGRVATGYPGDNLINQPNLIEPQILPGSYPVCINIVRHKGGGGAFAFVTVNFTETKMLSWEPAGKFFTDSGDGCICDVSVIDLLRKKKEQMSREEWGQLKAASLQDGDGNVILDEKSGANAIVFRTCDWSYNCFLGRDHRGNISCLVVDGRVQSEGENLFARLFKLFF
jgi:hypothetical protein